MTFKEFISALFEKWSCKHEWHYLFKTDVWGMGKYPDYCVLHYMCKKCGKFKKVNSR
jgi:hypothetical protein